MLEIVLGRGLAWFTPWGTLRQFKVEALVANVLVRIIPTVKYLDMALLSRLRRQDGRDFPKVWPITIHSQSSSVIPSV